MKPPTFAALVAAVAKEIRDLRREMTAYAGTRQRAEVERDYSGLQTQVAAEIHAQVEALRQQMHDAEAQMQAAIARAAAPARMPRHQWKGTQVRFEVAPDEWSRWTDMQGPQGDTVLTVRRGFRPESLPLGEPAAEPEGFIVRQGGEWRRATLAQMQQWFGAGALPPGAVTLAGLLVTVEGEPVTVH